MLINLRNGMLTGKKLPYDAEVEYLSSSENAGASGVSPVYIDTGVALSAGIKMSVTAAFNSTAYQLMGCYGGQYGRFDIGINNSRVFVTSIGATSTRSTADTNIHEFVLDAPNAMAYIDGVGIATGTFSIDIPGNVILFSRGRGDRTPPLDYTAAYSKVNIKIYSCKIWQNGVLVRDFIPVRKKTVGYLYDRVSGKLFGNAGTGDFVLGPDVVPVEYIESTGTQYIDSGISVANGDSFEMSVLGAFTGMSSGMQLHGVNSGAYFGKLANGNYTVAGLDTNVADDTNSHRFIMSATIGNSKVVTLKIDEATYTRTRNNAAGIIGLFNLIDVDYTPPRVMVYPCKFKMRHCSVTRNSSSVRDYVPVRVGTEGAMMDVLTRRIYRNAGTGAFTYGNDLKYPIPAA